MQERIWKWCVHEGFDEGNIKTNNDSTHSDENNVHVKSWSQEAIELEDEDLSWRLVGLAVLLSSLKTYLGFLKINRIYRIENLSPTCII